MVDRVSRGPGPQRRTRPPVNGGRIREALARELLLLGFLHVLLVVLRLRLAAALARAGAGSSSFSLLRRGRHFRRRRRGSRRRASAASSSAVITRGITIVATVGSSPFGERNGLHARRAASSPERCSECPAWRFERSTSMNSGRSFGRQAMSSSFMHVLHEAAGHLHAGRDLRVHEVQRHLHVDLLVRRDALEVRVQDQRLERVHLVVAQQHLRLLGARAPCRGWRRGTPPCLSLKQQVLVVELDGLRVLAGAVEDARHLRLAAQAAARTRALQRSAVRL